MINHATATKSAKTANLTPHAHPALEPATASLHTGAVPHVAAREKVEDCLLVQPRRHLALFTAPAARRCS